MNPIQVVSFILFTAGVGLYASYKVRKDNLDDPDGYFLAGRSLTGVVIAGSLILTNISTEHLIGMNGSSYKNGSLVITWEVTSAIALVIGALYFVPRYLKMGLTTIPEFLESRFDGLTRTLIAGMLIISFIVTLLPIVLYTGAINIEGLFDLSDTLGITKEEGIWISVLVVGILGAIYSIYGGLKMVAYTDTINGFGLLIAGLCVPAFALYAIGDGNMMHGLTTVYDHAPEKFRVISDEPSYGSGSRDAILPFSVLFTGMIINQLYFWCMHQHIIQRALGAKSLKEAQKGLLLAGGIKILLPLIIILPGIIAYYYFGDSFYDQDDAVYPALVKKVLPSWLSGFFAAVIVGAILSTFNSALNSAATIFSLDIYKKYFNLEAQPNRLVRIGRIVSLLLAGFAIIIAPFVASAPQGLYQLLQQLNGIFFIPMASVIIAGFMFKNVSAFGAKVGLVFGLCFYIFFNFIIEVDLHFVHIWGIEFILNIAVMHLASSFRPNATFFQIQDVEAVNLTPWKHRKWISALLVAITVGIYIALGSH